MPQTITDLRPLWDATRVLSNPYKGWYHHLLDNGTRDYAVESDAEIDDFPGMDHLYIRLSWAHFEPAEGQFNRSWIEDAIKHWVTKGYGLSLRISTCETGEPHATPQWVIAAGAKGAMHKAYRGECWVPDYNDPIFLAKLDRFVEQLAKRYDGKPWLRYVDIGLGTWGEGHNFPMLPDAPIPVDAVKKHIDIYRKHFHSSVLVLSDDAVHIHGRAPEEEKELLDYAIANGLTWRDDSILTWPGLHNWPESFNVARPEFFDSAWRKFPTILETSHYHEALRDGAYNTTDSGSIRAYGDLRGSVTLTHATYLGYHGNAKRWLADHPQLAKELANRLGYWYFPRAVSITGRTLTIGWENKGAAPAYNRFALRAKVSTGGKSTIVRLSESNNLAWLSGAVHEESYALPVDVTGARISVALFDTDSSPERPVEIGLQESLRDSDGYYCILED